MEEGIDTLLDLDRFGITLLEELEHIAPQPHMLAIQHLGIEMGPQVLQRQVTKNAPFPFRHRRQGHIASDCRALCNGPRRLDGWRHSRFSTTTQDMLFRAYTGNELLTWVRLAELIGQIQAMHGIFGVE